MKITVTKGIMTLNVMYIIHVRIFIHKIIAFHFVLYFSIPTYCTVHDLHEKYDNSEYDLT